MLNTTGSSTPDKLKHSCLKLHGALGSFAQKLLRPKLWHEASEKEIFGLFLEPGKHIDTANFYGD
jgi:hypothetical protein